MPTSASLERDVMRKVTWRILPFLTLCYIFSLVDRANVGMASLQMNGDLGFSKAAFGLGASLYFYAYAIAEIPSNIMLEKVGARLWLARIMITWGFISAGMSFVRGVQSFYAARLLLGAAEAGFFPGVILYLTYWVPAQFRGRFVAAFAIAIPMASFLGSPLSGLLLQMNGMAGLRGWQWLFILEGLPAALLGLVCLFVLTDHPAKASWLSEPERQWLVDQLARALHPPGTAHGESAWTLVRDKGFWIMALTCSGASAAGSVLSVWQPQLLKSFGLTNLQTGLVNSIPYGLAAVLMVLWGMHSDRTGERRWHTAIPLLLIALGVGGTFVIGSLAPTMALLSMVLIGAYGFKGPFWSLVSDWLAKPTAAAGIAAINAISNLIGGGVMVNVYGLLHEKTASYAEALAPLAIMTLTSVALLLMLSRRRAAPVTAALSSEY